MELTLQGSQERFCSRLLGAGAGIRDQEHGSLGHRVKPGARLKDRERGSRRQMRIQVGLQESKTRGPESKKYP
jgi:hypothetical protein